MICPYCFCQIKLTFRCCGKLFPGRGYSTKCPVCKKKTISKVCPECNNELPYTSHNQKSLIFSIIGTKESGKSHYISVLIDKILNEIGNSFECSLQALNDETIYRYREDFYNPVFKNRETINVTLSGKTNKVVRKPLLYNLSFCGRDLFGRKKIKNVVTLAFFDTAGEDLNSEDTMSTVNKYIYNSSGIILLIDPLQYSIIREKLKNSIKLPTISTNGNDLLSRIINLIRKAKNISNNKLINIPIALSLSKLDVLTDILNASYIVKDNSPHISKGEFDKKDCLAVNNEIMSFINRFGDSNFLNLLSSNFLNYSCFGITALGSNPNLTNKIERLLPKRVEDPFLWLLLKNKVL